MAMMAQVATSKWHAVDLHGTLAKEATEPKRARSPYYIGPPVPAMVERVKGWLENGDGVSIWTDDVNLDNPEMKMQVTLGIQGWCQKNVGQLLEVTCMKSPKFTDYWDNRAVAVELNTGKPLSDPESAYADAVEDAKEK